MFDARAVLGIVLYFKEKVLKPLQKDGYLNRCDVPIKRDSHRKVAVFFSCETNRNFYVMGGFRYPKPW